MELSYLAGGGLVHLSDRDAISFLSHFFFLLGLLRFFFLYKLFLEHASGCGYYYLPLSLLKEIEREREIHYYYEVEEIKTYYFFCPSCLSRKKNGEKIRYEYYSV